MTALEKLEIACAIVGSLVTASTIVAGLALLAFVAC